MATAHLKTPFFRDKAPPWRPLSALHKKATMMLSMKTPALSLAFFLGLSACATNAPLETLYDKAEAPESRKTMLVFLRGRGGNHEDLVAQGYVKDLRDRNIPVDAALPNAHFGYYIGETLVPRLEADVVEPARAEGYESFWLVGFSMGGLGALMYARQHPKDVEGVLVIAPFLGYEDIIREIAKAGGVRSWEPGAHDPAKDWQRAFWSWLKQCDEGKQARPPVYLGYGREDSFAPACRLLEDLLPEDHVISIPGGHTNTIMRKVWRLFLERGVLGPPFK